MSERNGCDESVWQGWHGARCGKKATHGTKCKVHAKSDTLATVTIYAARLNGYPDEERKVEVESCEVTETPSGYRVPSDGRSGLAFDCARRFDKGAVSFSPAAAVAALVESLARKADAAQGNLDRALASLAIAKAWPS